MIYIYIYKTKSRNVKIKPNTPKSLKQSTTSPALNQSISGTRFSVYNGEYSKQNWDGIKESWHKVRYCKAKDRKYVRKSPKRHSWNNKTLYTIIFIPEGFWFSNMFRISKIKSEQINSGKRVRWEISSQRRKNKYSGWCGEQEREGEKEWKDMPTYRGTTTQNSWN